MRSLREDAFQSSGPRATYFPVFSDYVEDVVLAANTIVRVPIPTGAQYVVFAFSGDFRAKLGLVGTTLADPSATTTDGSGSELNPTTRRIPVTLDPDVTPVVPTHVCLIAAAACKGSLTFYQ